jgi:hypothetical protein
MENEKTFNHGVGKRIRQLMDETEGLTVRSIAEDLQKDYDLRKLYPDDIQRRIKNPNPFFVLWFSNRYDFNEDFIFYGGDRKHTKIHRPKLLP